MPAADQVANGGDTSRDYGFPGTPYPQQRQLMDALYEAMQEGAVGLFESPTGTGKTLAIICAVSTFLRHRRQADINLRHCSSAHEQEDWVEAHSASKIGDQRRQLAIAQIARRRLRYSRIGHINCNTHKRGAKTRRRRQRPQQQQRSDHALLLESPSSYGDATDSEEEESGEANVTRDKLTVRPLRVIFATRTHSQLAQFASELRRTPHAAAIDVDPVHAVTAILFGSRKHMCINGNVRNLSSAAAVNDRCRELHEKGSSTSGKRGRGTYGGCIYRESRNALRALQNSALSKIHAPQELEDVAKSLSACPYYAARGAIDSHDADIIAVPYAALLHAPTRRALGLVVDEDTVVVFDEAHNLVQAACDLNSCIVSKFAIQITATALHNYSQRYKDRLSPNSTFHVRQLMALASGLAKIVGTVTKGKPSVIRPPKLLFDAAVDNVNLFALVDFIETSKLGNKLRGFINHNDLTLIQPLNSTQKAPPSQSNNTQQPDSRCNAAISAFIAFLTAISSCASYGRVTIQPGKHLKYFVLDPASLFADTVRNARTILLLGGTLSPRIAIRERLLRDIPHPLREFQCNHVVPASHVRSLILGNGSDGRPLQLTHRVRNQSPTIDDTVDTTIIHLANTAPGGVIAFFTSYDILANMQSRWSHNKVLTKLSKPAYFESRTQKSAFDDFTTAIHNHPAKGAFLAAVMGGRLSEGINFADDLARLVIVVGMPFANPSDPEMAESLKSLPDTAHRARRLQHACLTVVNQCIGRAVRHANDYAAVVLLDTRYRRTSIHNLLPQFLTRNISVVDVFRDAVLALQLFFEQRDQNWRSRLMLQVGDNKVEQA